MKRVYAGWLLLLGYLVLSAAPAQATLKEITVDASKAHCQHPKFSPDGTLIAFEVRHVEKRAIDLRIYDVRSGETKIIRAGTTVLDEDSDKRGMVARELAWSPKGNRYLYTSNGSGNVYDIYMSREGRLKWSSRAKNDGQPAWSPDGKRIVFTSARTGKGDLYWVNVSKMNPRRLTKNPESTEFFAAWDPSNSKRLAYVRHTDQSDRIYIINNVFAPSPVRLTSWKSSISEVNPSWSLDGKRIAFFGVRDDGSANLYLGEAGEKPKLLARNIAKSDQAGPAWSPDGKYLFFVQKTSGTTDVITAINVETNAKRTIETGTQVNNELSVVARGGKWHIAFSSQGKTASNEKVYRKLYIKTIQPL